MQKKVLLIFLLFSNITIAQEPLIESLTLDKALAYALEHSPSLNIERLKLEEASIRLKETSLQYIPDIFLSGGLQRNIIIPTTPVPAYLFDPSAEESELMYLKFNTKWNSSAGVNLTYDLFNPEKVNRVAEQQHQVKIQEYTAQISEDEMEKRVALAYAEAVITKEQKQLLREDTAYYSELLSNANQLFLKEMITLSEKNDAHRAYNESVVAYIEGEKLADNRKAELLFLIGMDVTATNIASLKLEEDITKLLELVEQKVSPVNSLISLEVIRQQEVVGLAALRLKSASWKYAPTLSLKGYYGANYFYNELSLFNTDFWRGSSYIGISLSIPVTRSLSTAKEVAQMRLQQQMEREGLRDIVNSREKDRLNELYLLQSRRESFRLRQENWKMSLQNEPAIQLQFKKGYIQQSALLSEKLKQQQNRQSFLQSAYDLLSSLISLY